MRDCDIAFECLKLYSSASPWPCPSFGIVENSVGYQGTTQCVLDRYALWIGAAAVLHAARDRLVLQPGDSYVAHLAWYGASVVGVLAVGAKKVPAQAETGAGSECQEHHARRGRRRR